MAAVPSGGAASHKPILSDSGFRGDDWLAHWAQAYGAQVFPLSKAAPRAERRWFSSARQVVETTFANLTREFWAQVSRCPQHVGAVDAGGGESGGV